VAIQLFDLKGILDFHVAALLMKLLAIRLSQQAGKSLVIAKTI